MKDNLEMILTFPLLIVGIILALIGVVAYTVLTTLILVLDCSLTSVYKFRKWVF